MKIKKVEIQAFRAYDKVEDGTFDFSINDAECADFVSLYAPNGFGKTSFYDAVEYGYTKNIDRLIKNENNKRTYRLDKILNQNDENKHYILRNKNSDEELPSFIKIATTKTDSLIETKIDKPRRGSSDFKFEDSNTENKYFREVILSQDWISGFLKEDNPQGRYEKFIEYFGDKEVDNYYKKLSELIKENDKEIAEIDKKIEEIQPKLNFDSDTEILTKVNEKIRELNSEENIFFELDTYTSEKDIVKLENAITERSSQIKTEIDKREKAISELEILLYGDEKNISFNQFYSYRKELLSLKEEKEKLENIKNQFSELKNAKITLGNIEKFILELKESQSEKNNILNLTEKYIIDTNYIHEKKNEIKKLSQQKIEKEKEALLQEQKEKNLEVPLNSISQSIEEISKVLERLPDIESSLKNITIIRKEISDMFLTERKNLESLSIQEKSLKSKIEYFKNIIDNIDKDVFPSIFDKEMEKYTKTLNGIRENSEIIKNSRREIKNIEKEISKQNNFKKDLELFISKGLSIITEQNTDACPLCNQKYESYSVLAEKVANNSFLSEQSNILLNKKKEVENIIFEYSKKLQENTDDFRKNILKEININEEKLKETGSKIAGKEKFIKEKESQDEVETKKYFEIQKSILNKSVDDYRIWGEAELSKLKKDKEEKIKEIDRIRKEIKDTNDKIQIDTKNIELLKEDIGKFDQSVISQVTDFFSHQYPNKDIDFEHIKSDLQNISNQLLDYGKQKVENNEKIKSLKENLLSFKEEEIINKNNDILAKINSIDNSIKKFKEKAKNYIANERHFSENKFKQLKKENEDKKLKLQEENDKLKLLSKLKDNVLPFLEYDKAKNEVEELGNKTIVKKKVSEKLEEEKKRVSEYLENQISSFFYEDLINDLYRRIDPHPEYKEIKFVPDFSNSKPLLNVSVKTEEGNGIIPNLYFSQAQLNILSLCIFLAKALNAKDEEGSPIDCIFIDDPIQSMDSINILSTIDLLRGIVVNEKKQIILSTHDENFHNLLKKKIPSELFKSKFLELETFGKVKR